MTNAVVLSVCRRGRYPHDLKGQVIYAFVTLKADEQPSEELRRPLVQCVRTAIGPIASPDIIHWTERLPKTRSGKIMHRVLRKIASAEFEALGDTSTLADPAVIEELVAERRTSPQRQTKARPQIPQRPSDDGED